MNLSPLSTARSRFGAVPPAPACRFCRKPLSTLERVRGDVCDTMDCRRQVADAVTRQRRLAELDALRSAAAQARGEPALARAPMLWLRHHADDVEAPAAADVADLRERLLALEAEERDDLQGPGEDEAASPPIAGQLCALCRGRCCRYGLQGRAFLEPHHLRGWLAERPDATWADAVDHYLGLLPALHLHGSCLFHGERGCVLPRDRRSDVCNRHACDALDELRDIAAAEPSAVVVVGIVAARRTQGAVVSAAGRWPLPD